MIKKLIILILLGYGGWQAYNKYYAGGEADLQTARNFLPNIIEVTANQVEYLIKSGGRNQRPTLLYIYDSKCLLCQWHFDDINHFARQYSRKQVNIVMLSLDVDEMDLARFLINNPPPVRPLLLKAGERENLFSKMRKLGSDYDGTLPHIAVINKAGHFNDVGVGWDPKNKINGFLLRSIDVKQ